MNRRNFTKNVVLLGVGAVGANAGLAMGAEKTQSAASDFYEVPSKKIPVRKFDVVIAGGGTAGVVAALAAARQGAKTALIETKGYTGGTVVEGGTALHSFFNLWTAFPGVKKRQVVRGIPNEIVERLLKVGGCSGHAEEKFAVGYDSVSTSVDTELYKLVTMEMLDEAGVFMALNSMVTGAAMEGSRVRGVIVESRSGQELFQAEAFVDSTAYGHLAAFAGAKYTEPNDHAVANSIGVGGVKLDEVVAYIKSSGGIHSLALGLRSGLPDKITRLEGDNSDRLGIKTFTTVHDDYLMFVKFNVQMPVSPTNRDATAKAELQLRKQQDAWIRAARKKVPGMEKAFIARTSPTLNIRRARAIVCDYDITLPDVLEARHFDDDIMAYGFHDNAPRLQVKNGGTYGIPYKALRVAGIENLLAAGMLITSNHDAHMSTRNTVCCMGQGQAAGTAAAICAAKKCGTRDIAYRDLRAALLKADVYLEKELDDKL